MAMSDIYCLMLLKMDYGYTDEQIGKLFGK